MGAGRGHAREPAAELAGGGLGSSNRVDPLEEAARNLSQFLPEVNLTAGLEPGRQPTLVSCKLPHAPEEDRLADAPQPRQHDAPLRDALPQPSEQDRGLLELSVAADERPGRDTRPRRERIQGSGR